MFYDLCVGSFGKSRKTSRHLLIVDRVPAYSRVRIVDFIITV
jgi:hypothetical protein